MSNREADTKSALIDVLFERGRKFSSTWPEVSRKYISGLTYLNESFILLTKKICFSCRNFLWEFTSSNWIRHSVLNEPSSQSNGARFSFAIVSYLFLCPQLDWKLSVDDERRIVCRDFRVDNFPSKFKESQKSSPLRHSRSTSRADRDKICWKVCFILVSLFNVKCEERRNSCEGEMCFRWAANRDLRGSLAYPSACFDRDLIKQTPTESERTKTNVKGVETTEGQAT